jgi:hypothetical protein
MILDILLEDVKRTKQSSIKIKHPEILEVPKDKLFWDLPITHYENLVQKIGLTPVVRALLNLESYNNRKDPLIRKRSQIIVERLKKGK